MYVSNDWIGDLGQGKPEDCTKYFESIFGTWASPAFDVSSEPQQRAVRVEFVCAPRSEKLQETIRSMRASAAGKDEVPIDVIRKAFIPLHMTIHDCLRRAWMEADAGGPQPHRDESASEAVLLMVC